LDLSSKQVSTVGLQTLMVERIFGLNNCRRRQER
jgi:hypothetical protein